MEIVSNVFEQLATTADAVILVYLISGLFEDRFQHKWWHRIIAVIAEYGVMTALQDSYWGTIIGGIAVMVLYAFIFYKDNILRMLAAIVVFFICVPIINNAGIQLVSIVSRMDVTDIVKPGSVARIFLLVFVKLALWAVIRQIMHLFREMQVNVYTSAIGMSVLAISFVVSTVLCKISGSFNMDYTQQIEILIADVGLIVLNIVVTMIIQRLRIYEQNQIEEQLIEKRLEDERLLLAKINDNYELVRTMRHDTKHYYSILQAMIEKKQYDEAKELLEFVTGNKLKYGYAIYTGNNIIDNVVNAKSRICEERGIRFDFQMTGKVSGKIETDIGVIISNLIDNAIEAQEHVKKGKITLSIDAVEGMCRLDMSNTINGSVLESNPGLVTSKKDKELHGLGIKSIYRILKNLDGMMDIYEEGEALNFHIEFKNDVVRAV